MNPFKFHFFSFLIIILFSFIVFYPSFKLAFQDDDWRGVVLPKTDYADGRFFTPYGIQLWFVGNLYNFLGFDFRSYYILSFILRNLLAFGVLIFLYRFTKNRFASFLGGLLIVVGFSGLQTTYEIANMNVYIALIAFIVFLTAFILNLNKSSVTNFITMVLSLLFATLASPVRTYPLYAWAFIIDAIGLLFFFSKPRLKLFLARQLLFFLLFLSLYQLGIFSWFSLDNPQKNKIYDLNKFVSEVLLFLANLDFSIFTNFLKGLGNIFFPSNLDKGPISIILGSIYLIILIGLLLCLIKRRKEKIYYFFSFFLWPLLFYSGYFIVYLGGYEEVSKDTVMLESYRRYLLPPFIGFCISLALLFSYSNKRKLLLLMFFILITAHAFSSYTFLSNLSGYRDGRFMINIWNQFKESVPESSLDPKRVNLFYFETDGSKRASYTLDDGFILHVATLYKIPQRGSITSSPDEILSFTGRIRHTFSFSELLTFIEKGFLNDPGAVSWDRIFAFRLQGDKLINIKEEVRKKVEKPINY